MAGARGGRGTHYAQTPYGQLDVNAARGLADMIANKCKLSKQHRSWVTMALCCFAHMNDDEQPNFTCGARQLSKDSGASEAAASRFLESEARSGNLIDLDAGAKRGAMHKRAFPWYTQPPCDSDPFADEYSYRD